MKHSSVETLFVVAACTFAMGWLGGYLLQEVWTGNSRWHDIVGFAAYLCGPLPLIPGLMVIAGVLLVVMKK